MKTTIHLEDIPFEIEYDYYPEEQPVYYYKDGTGHPGSAEEVNVNAIMFKGTDFFDLLDDKKEKIEELILEQIHNNADYEY